MTSSVKSSEYKTQTITPKQKKVRKKGEKV